MAKKKETSKTKALRLLREIHHHRHEMDHLPCKVTLTTMASISSALFLMEVNGEEGVFYIGPQDIPKGTGNEPYLGYFLEALARLGKMTQRERWRAEKAINDAAHRRRAREALKDLHDEAKQHGFRLVKAQ